MSLADEFPEITKRNEPLAPFTHLTIGGPAEFLVQPRSVDELNAVLAACQRDKVPVRMLGGGFNLLVQDDPVPGAVIRLTAEPFTFLRRDGKKVTAGGGAALFDLIAFAVKHGLGGLETLVGIRGTVGGSVRCNVGDRSGEISQAVRNVTVLTDAGKVQVRGRDELTFREHDSDIDEAVILSVEFELETEPPEQVLKKMRKAWIQRKTSEPLSFQKYVRLFRNPPGNTAAALIDRAQLTKARTGAAELSERNSNYAVAHPGTTARDIIQLADHVKAKVKERTGVALERELHVW
ncbi:UDP-N-acetylenolpyruvoylglucosamine reductase MurB [Gemmata obscuriglobus]|uniref:UDP-N-acetylenolpyruvoylglucosamine reductase n=1 Tax=Gemmata obscuriglobus TaxID=114 RepID=A0A2Z3GX54_9BACT|nr:UDP-N-acetylmuramate dehydrogenase [Gemmata obscuriglobus]AWM37968.1 UDP-N-acetylenolpyruvoylglucosamine reductase [Gemmata obscuriglobus]QEG29172.1 UDP-N-acetylenolpyruvoylglucosamine reductase MurB [Gemmata obscuriglobus]VTS07919.1 udp-n-acetylenolpyruvoylglucosamine reductase : UDP-N-acetylenolpyruvoylglucosamine reductase OS=Planctomyces limnophilus (strain ATCC 43296 / DSM 3776 / IFAM 1008 / 290) GN=murB PE=3 SV=1: FAD_binding_4: MurB_C [Gemmata obscuriglobus UQM 2246]